MRMIWKGILISLIAVTPLFGEDGHQSYLSYEAGGGVVVQPGDDRPIDARENLPVYAGDEVRTSRSGRTEVRLSDNNVVAIDRDSAVLFSSMADSYDAEVNAPTVVRLVSGKVIMHHAQSNKGDPLRLDTDVATYVSTREAIYTVEADNRGRDNLVVFLGSLEVRTPGSTTRVRKGDQVRVDDEGVNTIRGASQYSLLDFERWYLDRADQLTESGRYLDGRLSYAESQLGSHGAWVYMNDYGSWAWRPWVSVGWRPYYNGYWHRGGRSGSLVWVSNDPWGWAPYHYGRWVNTIQGWYWLPGGGYSPAWVYWAWGPSWTGWVPAGYYDCYRPYSSWLYRPYDRVGYGFYGSVHLSNVNLGPWVFVDSGVLLSRRVDRAALTTDQLRGRLAREGDRAAVSRGVMRLNPKESRDPSAAVRELSRRGLGGGTGNGGSGNTTDITPFFRRDPELPTAVRERISRIARPAAESTESPVRVPSIDRSGGGSQPSRPDSALDRGRETLRDRGSAGSTDRDPATGRQSVEQPRDREVTRDVVRKPSESGAAGETSSPSTGSRSRIQRDPIPENPSEKGTSDSWRGRDADRPQPPTESTRGTREAETSRRPETPSSPSRIDSSNDVSRRIIDRIGGARIVPPTSTGSSSGDTTRSGSTSRSDSGRTSGSRDQGSSRTATPERTRSSSERSRERATAPRATAPTRSEKPPSSQSAPKREAPKQESKSRSKD